MRFTEARLQLFMHGPGISNDSGAPEFHEAGFLGSLRPYQGLDEANFHCIMEALLTVGERLHQEPQVDRDLIQAIWTICHTARDWGLAPMGMLQRNRLISPEDTARLTRWIDTFETVALRLLSGGSPHHAVYYYAEYVVEFGGPRHAASIIDLLVRAIADPATGDRIGLIAHALVALGPLATTALPALRAAEHRDYTWFIPTDRCTEETRTTIREAIRAITGEA